MRTLGRLLGIGALAVAAGCWRQPPEQVAGVAPLLAELNAGGGPVRMPSEDTPAPANAPASADVPAPPPKAPPAVAVASARKTAPVVEPDDGAALEGVAITEPAAPVAAAPAVLTGQGNEDPFEAVAQAAPKDPAHNGAAPPAAPAVEVAALPKQPVAAQDPARKPVQEPAVTKTPVVPSEKQPASAPTQTLAKEAQKPPTRVGYLAKNCPVVCMVGGQPISRTLSRGTEVRVLERRSIAARGDGYVVDGGKDGSPKAWLPAKAITFEKPGSGEAVPAKEHANEPAAGKEPEVAAAPTDDRKAWGAKIGALYRKSEEERNDRLANQYLGEAQRELAGFARKYGDKAKLEVQLQCGWARINPGTGKVEVR